MGYTREYNRHAEGRAWEILGYTHAGRIVCPECADARYDAATLSGENSSVGIDNPAPVFLCDEIPPQWACDHCDATIVAQQ